MRKETEAALVGPLPAILDVLDTKPIIVLMDFSLTPSQIFREFSGVFCDRTPIPSFKAFDFLEFAVHHEIGHKRTEDLLRNAPNELLPGIQLGVDRNSISIRNLQEGIADAYGILMALRSGAPFEFAELVASMRTLGAFSKHYQSFDTEFSATVGGALRKRVVSEYYTAPMIDEAILRAKRLAEAGALTSSSDEYLLGLAISIGREFKPSAETLTDLSVLATTLNFNNYLHANLAAIPDRKLSLSPLVVESCLKEVAAAGSFTPRGGNSLEAFLFEGVKGTQSPFHRPSVPVTSELTEIFERYKQARKFLEQNGITPRTPESFEQMQREIEATIALPMNHTPNRTLRREFEDSLAADEKCDAPFSGRWSAAGVKSVLNRSGPWEHEFTYRRECVRWSDSHPDAPSFVGKFIAANSTRSPS